MRVIDGAAAGSGCLDALLDAVPDHCASLVATSTAAFTSVDDLALRIIQSHPGDDLAGRAVSSSLIAGSGNSPAPYVDDAPDEPSVGALAQPVRRWLAERLDQPYDLAALARAFHVSTRTMLRRFSRETGQSPLAFLQQTRVDVAKRLLEAPDHTVTSAMRHVGYNDPASFRRLFTARAGMTPTAYRRQFHVRGRMPPQPPEGPLVIGRDNRPPPC